jgi:ribosomal peptide maturation radical SAM protein 1
MRQLKDIKQKILTVCEGGDILIIVPPFGSIYDTALGPHILQSLARGKGYKTDILYLNMMLASVIGAEQYDNIYFSPEFWMLSERLFAGSAYGLPSLGKHAGSREGMSGNNPFHFDREPYLQTEHLCKSFIDEVIPVIAGLDYKITGCSISMMRQTNCGVALLKGIKNHSPETVTIIGGGSCKDEMAEGIASLSKAIDYIFPGESETSFLDFLKGWSAQELPSRGIIRGSPPSHLDTLPLADYDVFFKQYHHFLGEVNREKIRMWYETSRGCWWARESKCAFCSEHHKISYRQKSAAKAIDDLARIGRAYPDQLLSMSDIIMPQSYHGELLPVLSRKSEKSEKKGFPSLGYQMRASLDLEDLVNLKKAKVNAILPGIETFSTPLLKLMNKGITAMQNLLLLRNAVSVGIYVDWYLLWGFPGDRLSDYEEVLRILPLIRHLQPPRKLAHMVLMRYSPYLDQRQKYKITNVRPWPVFDNVYPGWAGLEKLAVYYTGDYPCESHDNPEIIQEIDNQVVIWKKTWKQATLSMGHFMDAFAIHDGRDIHEKAKTHVLDYQQAKEIMNCRIYDGSENLRWAVAEKLGVVVDSWYVPLVAASSELLLEFSV